jgi:DNA end-binding protein Ku
MKAYWKGTLECDLLPMPVKLYAAVSAHEPRFHYLHASCHTPVESLRHCPQCDVVVSGEEVVRGYEHADALVVVTDQELAALPRPVAHVITVRQCVHAHAIDPVRFDRAFYVEPDGGAKKSYAVLCDVLRQSGMVLLGTALLRDRERMVVLRSAQGVLVLHTLFAPAEMFDTERLDLPHRPPHPVESKSAEELLVRLSRAYAPEQWVDASHEALTSLVSAQSGEAHRPDSPRAASDTARCDARFSRDCGMSGWHEGRIHSLAVT